jgi:hypothetical protein
MSDDLGNPGKPVAEVDPDDLKTFWQEVRNLQARHPSQHIGISFEVMKAIYKPGSLNHDLGAQPISSRAAGYLGQG